MRETIDIAKALSDANRVRALMLLTDGSLCVCQIIEFLGLAPSTVSKHLALLRQAGLVLDEKRGQQVFYRLRVHCILNFFGCVEAVLEEVGRCDVAESP